MRKSMHFRLTNTPKGYIIRVSDAAARHPKGERCMSDTKEWREERESAATACPCHRQKHRTEEEARALINRLSRIEGQVRGIRGMVERDAYCPDILTQVAAVTAALNAFNRELLAEHIRTCVADDLHAGRDEAVDELVATLHQLMR